MQQQDEQMSSLDEQGWAVSTKAGHIFLRRGPHAGLGGGVVLTWCGKAAAGAWAELVTAGFRCARLRAESLSSHSPQQHKNI